MDGTQDGISHLCASPQYAFLHLSAANSLYQQNTTTEDRIICEILDSLASSISLPEDVAVLD
jgi:hypothetical protein